MRDRITENVLIRGAQPRDAEALLSYLSSVGGETDNLSFGSEGVGLDVEEEAAYLERFLDQPNACRLGAWHDGALIGEASFQGYSQQRMSHRAELGVTVSKAWWHQGIGTMLLRALLSEARRRGIQQLELWVRSDNDRAIALYTAFGFTRVGRVDDFMRIERKPIAFDLMTLSL